ncbi:DUF2878 domain-containing protein [Desulfopila sp. IMCC35008]|uniref:DUF2878 domain-containing protein n=1 Tax=Desulfopila sp. IMCC35008 TaxID=2653858 RepID=UPI0013D24B3A|nr:DUF2878 domain-containing protein [Desulfopila sp. IMCC35008]
MKLVINALVYQAVWFLAILWGNTGALFGCILILILLATSEQKIADIRMIGFLIFLGLLVDGTLQQVGFFSFSNPGLPIPFWLLVIWVGLAMTIHHSLSWLKHNLPLAAIFGGLGGPAAYWAGTRLGAASFNWSLSVSLCILAVIWALLFPIIVFYGRKVHPVKMYDETPLIKT